MNDILNPGDGEGEVTLRWVFARGTDRIDVRRSVAPTSTQVEVSDGGGVRTFSFANRAALVAFQAGFEQALIQTGWTLATFDPERRQGNDRRAKPRANDRRGSLALVWAR
jgi:hypothetical protein